MTELSKPILIGERVRIYPRGKKKIYTADFWYDGKHRRRSLKTRNLKLARQKALQLENQLLEGSYQSALPPMPLSEAINGFLAHIGTENRRPKTITKYKGMLQTFREFAESNNVFRLSQVTLGLVDKYRAFRKPDLSMKSMHNEAVMLKTLFKWTKQRRYIKDNPLAELKFQRPKLEPRGGPTRMEVERILKTACEPRRTQYAVIAFITRFPACAGERRHGPHGLVTPAIAPSLRPPRHSRLGSLENARAGTTGSAPDLANFIPDDLDNLQKAADASITDQSKDQHFLRSFFAYAKLPL